MEEQHAVPQDITGFQFKLVGDMTLKQFGELAFGAVMAYLFYASNWHPFLKWPMVFLFGFFGVALAFLPIEERPLDIWIANFFKAIYRPTYYIWEKNTTLARFAAPGLQVATKGVLPPPAQPQPQLQPWPFPPAGPTEKEKTENKEGKKAEEEKTREDATKPVSAPPPQPAGLSVTELEQLREQKLAELNQAQQKSKEKTVEAKTETQKTAKATEVISIDKLMEMRTQNIPSQEDQTKAVAASGVAQTAAVTPPWAAGGTGEMRIVDSPVKTRPTISLTDRPNIINGAVTEQRGAPMDGVIVIIKDKAGNSVRALKTNRLGQFIASTPLENGTYYLEFEMPGYTFNVYEIILTGQVIKSLDIKGKFSETKR